MNEFNKAVIFDLDGVLVHTDEYHYRAWKMLADKLGIYFDRTINHRLRGVSRMDSLEILLERHTGKPFTPEEKAAFAQEKNLCYRSLLLKMTPKDVDPQVPVMLKALHRRGYGLAIGSSSKNAKTILERTELLELFDAISDGSNITRSKPDPEVFLKAAQFLGLPPASCAVVEDAPAGIQAAKAAGMLAVGIGEAARFPETDQPISQISDLLMIFKEEK